MSTAIQEGGWAAKLFSSALFCLWLSIASVTVWFDTGPMAPAPLAAKGEAEQPRLPDPAAAAPAPVPAQATPASDPQADAA